MYDKNKIDTFCKMHQIKIIDTNKRVHKINKLDAVYFKSPKDYNLVDQMFYSETEPLFTVEITQSELEKIAEFESQVFNHMRAKGHYDMFTMIMEQKEREKNLKERYPAVKKAYERYSLMLKMAESGEL